MENLIQKYSPLSDQFRSDVVCIRTTFAFGGGAFGQKSFGHKAYSKVVGSEKGRSELRQLTIKSHVPYS
jgi:hypothetical protein